MTPRTFTIEMSDADWATIDQLAKEARYESTKDMVQGLLGHVEQGVRRPVAWERDWLIQFAGPDAVAETSRAMARQ